METVAYYLRYLAIYCMFGLTMALSAIDKVRNSPPEWFQQQFQDTLVASVPGLEISWRLAGALEIAVAVLVIVSIVMREFLPGIAKPWLKAALGVAAVTFMMLGVGQRISAEFDGASTLFFYFGATMATLLVVFWDERGQGNSPAPATT